MPLLETTIAYRSPTMPHDHSEHEQTPEQLGGYYLVDGKDLDEALELAAKVPGARYGTIEVRPVLELT